MNQHMLNGFKSEMEKRAGFLSAAIKPAKWVARKFWNAPLGNKVNMGLTTYFGGNAMVEGAQRASRAGSSMANMY